MALCIGSYLLLRLVIFGGNKSRVLLATHYVKLVAPVFRVKNDINLPRLHDCGPFARLGGLASLFVGDFCKQAAFLCEDVPADQAHAPDAVGGAEKGRHAELSMVFLHPILFGLRLGLELAIDVYGELQALHQELKLRTVVLQLDGEIVVEDEIRC